MIAGGWEGTSGDGNDMACVNVGRVDLLLCMSGCIIVWRVDVLLCKGGCCIVCRVGSWQPQAQASQLRVPWSPICIGLLSHGKGGSCRLVQRRMKKKGCVEGC